MDWSSGRVSSRPGWRSSRAGGCRRPRRPLLRPEVPRGRGRRRGRFPPLQRRPASVAPPSAPRVAPPPPPPPSRAAPPALEDLLGGRVLAWAGGLSLLAGLLFLLVIAISRDWIGEEARTLLAAATSMALLTLGAHGYERRGRTDSALAATATGIAGLFASIVVAVQGYELIPVAAGLALAFAVATTATILAIRWEAEGIAGLGILGAVASPVLVGAELGPATAAFLFLATASAVGVVLWQRWTWLAFATFVLATPQWVAWLVDRDAEHARDPRHAARVRRPRRPRRRRLRAAHAHGDGRLRPAPAARAQRARAGVDRVGRAVGDRRGHRRSRLARRPRGRAPRLCGGRPAHRRRLARPPARRRRARRRARGHRVRLGGRRPPARRRLGGHRRGHGRRSSGRRPTASTPRSRSAASPSTSASRSGTRSSTKRR